MSSIPDPTDGYAEATDPGAGSAAGAGERDGAAAGFPDMQPLQRCVDAWVTTTGIRYFDALTNTAILAEEVGEVARLSARLYGEQSFKRSADEASAPTDWAEELSDVLFVLTCLANQTGVDLTAAFARGMHKRSARDAQRHAGNEKLRS